MSAPPTTTTSSAQPIIDRILGRTADGRSPGAAMRHLHQPPSGHTDPRATARERDRGLHGDDLAAGPPRSGSTRAGDPLASLTGLIDDDSAAGEDNLGCFGWLRGVRERAVMLELRKKSGEVLAVGYSWIESIAYDPARGITLHLPSRQITIKGRNLNVASQSRPLIRLFEGLTRHRVPWVSEVGMNQSLAVTEDSVVIESLRW